MFQTLEAFGIIFENAKVVVDCNGRCWKPELDDVIFGCPLQGVPFEPIWKVHFLAFERNDIRFGAIQYDSSSKQR